MEILNPITPIEKEEIRFLNFPKKEVLSSKNEKLNRHLDLKRALVLGNLEHNKVKIIFADDLGIKRVETTIWGLTNEDVILKQATIIPRKRIIRVN